MRNLIKILQVNENGAIAQVGAAEITFAINNNNIVEIVRIPPPRECFVSLHLQKIAKEIVKKRTNEEKERIKTNYLQHKLPL